MVACELGDFWGLTVFESNWVSFVLPVWVIFFVKALGLTMTHGEQNSFFGFLLKVANPSRLNWRHWLTGLQKPLAFRRCFERFVVKTIPISGRTTKRFKRCCG